MIPHLLLTVYMSPYTILTCSAHATNIYFSKLKDKSLFIFTWLVLKS